MHAGKRVTSLRNHNGLVPYDLPWEQAADEWEGNDGAPAPIRCCSGEQVGHLAAERETEHGKSHMSMLQVLPWCFWGKCELYLNEELFLKNSNCIASGYRHWSLSVYLQFTAYKLVLWNKWNSRPRFSCPMVSRWISISWTLLDYQDRCNRYKTGTCDSCALLDQQIEVRWGKLGYSTCHWMLICEQLNQMLKLH